MCGIFGFTGPPDPELAAKMTALLAHRGPDGRGVAAADTLTIGSTRLAIQGIADGAQPLHNEAGDLALVCNGEIYNAPALRAEVERRGHRLRTGSDCEPILHLYEDEGDDLLARLDGMFAFALYDATRRRLLLARDRIGMKPLYLARPPDGRLLFASEIKALLAAPEVERRLDEDNLHRLVGSGSLLGGRTLFVGIRQLPPGHRLTWQDGVSETSPYWTLTAVGAANGAPARPTSEPVASFRQTFEAAVESHLASEAPLGFALSGGLDSSYVVAVAARIMGSRPRTFTVGFDGAGDERPWARLVAAHVGTEHHEIVETGERTLDRLPHAVWHLEHPRSGPLLLNDLFFHEVAPEARVVLVGEGSDELLGGYDRFKGALPPFSWLPGALGRLPYTARDGFLGALRGRREYPPPEVFAVRGSRRLERLLDYEVRERIEATQLTRLDRLAMAHGVEVRIPFMDRAVIELVHSLPPGWKTRWWGEKHLLREAARGVLPEAVRTRRKYGQREPAVFWRRPGVLESMATLVREAAARRSGAFLDRYLRPALRSRSLLDATNQYTLFRLVQIEIWHRLFLDPVSISAPPALASA